MRVWVTLGKTESGDDVGPYVWTERPTDVRVLEILYRDWPEEFSEVGFVNHYTEEVETIK